MADNDGFSNAHEMACGSDPSDKMNTPSDVDGDFIPDCLESDADNDGFSGAHETACGSDPLLQSETPADSDGDFIPDCLESDSDNDGFSDVHENTCSSDPTDSLDRPLDVDGDFVPDCLEPAEIVEKEVDPGGEIDTSGQLSFVLLFTLLMLSGLRLRKV